MASPQEFKKIVADPWYFATQCVRTRDPQDLDHPVKNFPDHAYLKMITDLWMREKSILVPKSRRMMLSWLGQVLFLWDAMFHVGRDIGFVSKKEEDADELIERTVFILENLQNLDKDLIPKYKRTYKYLEFPELNSRIMAFPSGGNQLRSYGLSGIMADEMAFWDDAKEMYSNSRPTIEGGGRFFGISSPAPGFFHRMVFDALGQDEADEIDESLQETQVYKPMKGMRVWQNPKNKFWVVEPHWRANPDKTEAGQQAIKDSMPIEKYNQEYELKWNTFAGKRVYEDYDSSEHEDDSIRPDYGLPLILGFDFGLTPACVVAQLQGQKLVFLREYVEFNMGIKRFMETVVIPSLRNEFPRWPDFKRDYICVIDPAGFQRVQTDESTCAHEISLKGFRPEPGPVTWEQRKQAVESFLISYTKDGSNLAVNPKTCPTLKKGFDGGYQYPKKVIDIQPDQVRPMKNMFSHVHDAAQYIAWRAGTMNYKKRANPPKPSYAWSKNEKTGTVR